MLYSKPLLLSVQLLSRVRLFATPWTTAHQASLSITNCQSLPKPMTTELVMPYNHLILCCPLLLLPSIFTVWRRPYEQSTEAGKHKASSVIHLALAMGVRHVAGKIQGHWRKVLMPAQESGFSLKAQRDSERFSAHEWHDEIGILKKIVLVLGFRKYRRENLKAIKTNILIVLRTLDFFESCFKLLV